LPCRDPDFGDDAEFDDGPPPGYCNIWSADLLDPLDLFDAVDETSALFILPAFQLAQSVDVVLPTLGTRQVPVRRPVPTAQTLRLIAQAAVRADCTRGAPSLPLSPTRP
jgi:hypothetical protein